MNNRLIGIMPKNYFGIFNFEQIINIDFIQLEPE